MTTKTDEQLRAEFEAWWKDRQPAVSIKEDAFAAYQAGRAALQSQPLIDDDHLSIVLDVYDNAMQKAFDGREFPNPCKPGTPEHKAWEKGSKEGKKKRDAGLPNSIALQSQDRGRLQYIADGGCAFDTWIQPDGSCKYRLMWPNYEDWEYQTAWFDSPAEAIDHARRIEGGVGNDRTRFGFHSLPDLPRLARMAWI